MENILSEFAEDLLLNDPTGFNRSKLREELFQMAATLRRKMDRGMSKEEAQKAEIIQKAIAASQAIVDIIWDNKYNT